MNGPGQTPDLERLAARQLAAYLNSVATGSALPISSSSDLCDTLELLIPRFLRRTHPEWENESIDGFYFSRAVKCGDTSAELVGTCILISDQTVTPFELDVAVSEDGLLRPLRIRLGEPGGGPLGISGPVCTSSAAAGMLDALNVRLNRVEWVYDFAIP
jgi:hypothetical protein